jgi:hypothetical protein
MQVNGLRVFLLVAGVLVAAAGHNVTAGDTSGDTSQVSEGELQQLFPGQFQVVVNGLLEVQVTANEDGSLSATQVGKSDTGRWEIRSGQLCITFSKWLDNRTHCSAVIEDGGWYKTANVAFQKNAPNE